MATKKKAAKAAPKIEGKPGNVSTYEGYAGTGDYAAGREQSGGQATPAQLKEDRARQRNS